VVRKNKNERSKNMFTYKGIKSNDMHLRVLNDISFTSPTRDVNVVQVPGRDGDLIMDNGRYNSVIRSVPCRLEAPDDVNIEHLANRINNWLIDDGRFHEFSWSNDPDFKYLARVEGDVSSSRMLSRLGRTVIDFRLHPVKYLRSSLEAREVASGIVLSNQFEIDAKPMIRIVGGGDITLHIGGRPLVLHGISEGCVIDSETQTITDLQGRVTLFERMRSPFPILRPGFNQVLFFRDDIQVFITPRLGALV